MFIQWAETAPPTAANESAQHPFLNNPSRPDGENLPLTLNQHPSILCRNILKIMVSLEKGLRLVEPDLLLPSFATSSPLSN